MKIGNLDLGQKPVLLAPMEDVTDSAFRLMCKQFGADLVYTEFVSADALIRHVEKTKQKLIIDENERPVAIQIYGRDTVAMADAAQLCEAAGADLVDLNFGCPVKRVAYKGAGAGMLQNIPQMLAITRAVVDAVKLPVTVKTRLGWDAEHIVITSLAEQLQDCGIQAITIHARTRAQMYSGQADWAYIKQVQENPRLHIPVIGNGDLVSAQDCYDAFEQYGVDGVMIGRASFGRPWIFREVKHLLNTGTPLPQENFQWYLDVLVEQITTCIERLGERRGILHSRRHLANTPLFKGIPDFRQTRIAMLQAETREKLFAILQEISTKYPSFGSQER